MIPINRAYIPDNVLVNVPEILPSYTGNNEAVAAGLPEGQMFFKTAYPHGVHVAIHATLITGDGFTLASGDGLTLIPYVY